MQVTFTKKEIDQLIAMLAEGFKLSKTKAKKVYEQGGFHIEFTEMVVRKGKKNWLRFKIEK